MQLFYSALSPYARKVRICAIELGLSDRIALRPVNPWEDDSYKAINPLGQVPALILDDGTVLYDSAVICAAMEQIAGKALTPSQGPPRWAALTRQALADGLGAAGIRTFRERLRSEGDRHGDAIDYQMAKLVAGLDRLEAASPFDAFTIGEIAVGCMLAWFDLRSVLDWRAGRPQLAEWHAAISLRPSFVATAPQP